MDLVFGLFGLGAVQDLEEVGRPAAHARVQVGLCRRGFARAGSQPQATSKQAKGRERTGALEVVVDVVAEHLDLGDGGGCDLGHRVPREQDWWRRVSTRPENTAEKINAPKVT